MDTVRMEKPLHLYINVNRGNGSSTRGRGYLWTTEKEPTGEEGESSLVTRTQLSKSGFLANVLAPISGCLFR